MSSTTDRISNQLCAYCGIYHNYSYEMCMAIMNGGHLVQAMNEKDAEIAALKERVRELEDKTNGYDLRLGDDFGDNPIELVLFLKKENKRLREALDKIAKSCPDDCATCPGGVSPNCESVEIAREAREGK